MSIIHSQFKMEHNAVLSDLQIKLKAWWELIIISLKRETSRDWLRFWDKSDEMNKKDAFECRQNTAKRAAVSFHHLSRGNKCLIFDNCRSTVSGFSFISSFQRHVMQISQRCFYLPQPCPGLPARHWQDTHFDFVIVSWYSRVTSGTPRSWSSALTNNRDDRLSRSARVKKTTRSSEWERARPSEKRILPPLTETEGILVNSPQSASSDPSAQSGSSSQTHSLEMQCMEALHWNWSGEQVLSATEGMKSCEKKKVIQTSYDIIFVEEAAEKEKNVVLQ